jgi:ABC-2 type transport system permease protein
MLRSVLAKSLRDLRRSFLWWTVGLAGYVALIVAVYPTIRDNEELEELMDTYPEVLKAFVAFGGELDFTSAAGYLGGELFSFMIPALFLVAAVGNGAGSIAGEEDRGTLDLLLSTPVSRRRVAVEKLASMCVEVAALGVVLWLALWIGARAVDMELSAAHLAAASASVVLLAILYGAVAFMLGAGTGRRGLAIGVAIAAAVSAYLVNSLAALVDVLEWPQKLSPFYHYAVADPLRQGLDPWHALFLVAVAAAAAVVGVVLFDRRDVAT